MVIIELMCLVVFGDDVRRDLSERAMSLASRQHTCACCGKEIIDKDNIELEPLVDSSVRYIAIHCGCSTFPRRQLDNVTEQHNTRQQDMSVPN